MKYLLFIKVEIHKIKIDDNNKKVFLDLSGEDTIIEHNELEEKKGEPHGEYTTHFEYGRWMIEGNFCYKISRSSVSF